MQSTRIFIAAGLVAIFMLVATGESQAYTRYAGNSCDTCHGEFTNGTSPQGNTIPGNDKHAMHRNNSEMNADCSLCHTTIGDNTFIGSSAGTASNPGLGCVGCHGRVEDGGNDGVSNGYGAGLRQHHDNAGVTGCRACHSDSNPANYTPVGENVIPPYYGVVADSNVAGPCNDVAMAKINENWTVGDFFGLDNDGDLIVDTLDSDCAPPSPTRGDFNFDGRADILWRNTSSGQNWAYFMDGSTIDPSSELNIVVDQNWQVAGIGDFDGDDDSDILWRNTATGQNWMYKMAGTVVGESVEVNTVGDQNWQVAGIGDFDGDGDDDILWRNSANGQNWMYLMNGENIASSLQVATVSTDWVVEGVGFYDAGGIADILWRNTGTGQVWMHLMNVNNVASSLPVASVLTLWQIEGTGDYNGDGMADVLWRRESTGQNWLWLMNGATIDTSTAVNTVTGTQWQIMGDGDYNGDGNADILWRNMTTGQNWLYLMSGSMISSSEGINSVTDTAWQLVEVP